MHDGPSDRLMLIAERHQLFLERKRAAARKESACQDARRPANAPAPTSAGATPESPSRSGCAASTADRPRGHFNVAPTAPPAVKESVAALVDHVYREMGEKPKAEVQALVDTQITTRSKRTDYVALLRLLGKPSTQREIADAAGVTTISVCLWLKANAERHGIAVVGKRARPNGGKASSLYYFNRDTP